MKIAISGGGIAGLATAIYLQASEHEVTIFEKSDGFTSEGYGLSIKSFGIEILRSFGVLDELKSKGITFSEFNIYKANGKLVRSIPEKIIGEMTGGAFPVGRADLHEALYKLISQDTPIFFNKWITNVEHLSRTERIIFNDGDCQEFDLVIIAEGLRSGTRKLLCENEGWYPTDIKYATTRINRKHPFKPGVVYTYKEVGKTISFFPVDESHVIMQGYFRNSEHSHLQQKEIQALLKKAYCGFTKEVTETLTSLRHDDFVFYDSVAMIKLARLVWNRVVLIGDAAYSTTFLSGMGASLSLLGAKLLTEGLATIPDIKLSLERFEEQMLPIAKQFQQNASDHMKHELKAKRFQLAIANLITRFIPFSIMIKKVSQKFELKNLVGV